MRISVEQSSTLERRLTVEVPEERIATETQDRLDKLAKNARIPGFRQGKAPAKVVRQQYGARVRDEVVGEILQSTFREAMTKEDLRPAGQPVIDPVTADPGTGLSYTATFEVFPQIELAPIESIEVSRRICEIGDADIDTMIDKLRQQHREWVAVERPAADGDQLSIDFAGFIDGEVFEGGTASDFKLALGSNSMIPGFEDGLRGTAAGDKVTLDLKFPDEYRATHLAGKPVRFDITVNKVAEPVLPTMDDAFFEKFGVKEGGVEAFRAEVRQNMEKERDRALRQKLVNDTMDKVAKAHDFALPQALIQDELGRLQQQMANDMMQRGLDPSVFGDQFAAIMRDRAAERVKLGLVMAEIIKQANLRADPAKVRKTIEDMASSYEDPGAVVRWYYQNPQQLQQVEGMCLEDEAVSWIIERAKVHDTPVSFDALLNPVQTDEKAEASS